MYIMVEEYFYYTGGIDMKSVGKNDRINLRLNSKQKETISKKAESLGMTTSKYLLHLAEHGSITIIDSKGLASEVYKLNQKLSLLEKYPAIPVQELRDAISQGIIDIIKISEEK